MLIPGTDLIVPPTPPPDIDIDAWEDSIGIVEGWQPQRLALTHFGAIEEPAEHLAGVRERLREEADLARELSEVEYEKRHRELVARHAVDEEATAELLQAVPPEYQWRGLDRYWAREAIERVSAAAPGYGRAIPRPRRPELRPLTSPDRGACRRGGVGDRRPGGMRRRERAGPRLQGQRHGRRRSRGPQSADPGLAEIVFENESERESDMQLIWVEGDRSPAEVVEAWPPRCRGNRFPDWFFGGGGIGLDAHGSESRRSRRSLEPGTYYAFNTEDRRPAGWWTT